jgi:hypothetical protein
MCVCVERKRNKIVCFQICILLTEIYLDKENINDEILILKLRL